MAALRYLAVLAALFVATHAQLFQGGRQTQAGSRFNFFDIELLKEIISHEGAHNFVISPASTKAVLAMLYEGSEGNTAVQIAKALRLNGNPASHQALFNNFLQSLRVRYPGSLVECANQIFVSPQVKVLEQYQQTLEKIYLSGAQNVEFTDTQLAAATINGWVTKNTHGIIRTLLPPQALDSQIKAVVANALYFRGKWAVPFAKKDTTIRCFQPKPSLCKNAFFMETVGHHGYAYIKELDAKALELQYQGSKFSMLFLLPNHDIHEMLRDLSYQPLNTIIPRLETTAVVVSLPRFAIEYEIDLTESLTKLGIRDLFSPAANLTGMIQRGGNVFISKLFQKAVIQVDEEGTIGAAASGAVAVPLQVPTLPRFEASRPFLFFLRDMETGNYLFEGLVEQPELAGNSETTPLPSSFTNPGSAPATQPNGHTILKPVSPFDYNPLAPKVQESSPISPTRPQNIGGAGMTTSYDPESNYTSGLATAASSHRPTGVEDSFNYPV